MDVWDYIVTLLWGMVIGVMLCTVFVRELVRFWRKQERKRDDRKESGDAE
jgi:predicted PurR-regulated permease PerM